jgi:hypothetical protein
MYYDSGLAPGSILIPWTFYEKFTVLAILILLCLIWFKYSEVPFFNSKCYETSGIITKSRTILSKISYETWGLIFVIVFCALLFRWCTQSDKEEIIANANRNTAQLMYKLNEIEKKQDIISAKLDQLRRQIDRLEAKIDEIQKDQKDLKELCATIKDLLMKLKAEMGQSSEGELKISYAYYAYMVQKGIAAASEHSGAKALDLASKVVQGASKKESFVGTVITTSGVPPFNPTDPKDNVWYKGFRGDPVNKKSKVSEDPSLLVSFKTIQEILQPFMLMHSAIRAILNFYVHNNNLGSIEGLIDTLKNGGANHINIYILRILFLDPFITDKILGPELVTIRNNLFTEKIDGVSNLKIIPEILKMYTETVAKELKASPNGVLDLTFNQQDMLKIQRTFFVVAQVKLKNPSLNLKGLMSNEMNLLIDPLKSKVILGLDHTQGPPGEDNDLYYNYESGELKRSTTN